MMNNLQLDKPIVFFDIEATGLHVIRDRIIQIALVKYTPGQDQPEEMTLLIHPGEVPISPEAEEVHGISLVSLEGQPTFDQVAQQIADFIGEGDLAGYNSDRFDIPILMESFERAGVGFSLEGRRRVDVMKIFMKMEPRTLSAAYRFYCGAQLDGAHDALVDVRATAAILDQQIARYKDVDYDDGKQVLSNPVKGDVKSLSDFTQDPHIVDATRRLKRDRSGTIVFNFGKYMGKPAGKVLFEDRNYYKWIQDKEFSVEVKQWTTKLLREYEQNHKAN